MDPWTDHAVTLAGRPLTGTGAFRLMPQDPLAEAEASGTLAPMARGWATCLAYRWRHPDDGEQDGVLLVASPEDDGTVRATLVDSWHQKPGPMHLTGAREGALTRLHATYMETWGWEVDLELSHAGVRLVMRNVVPAEALEMAPDGVDVQAGPYDAMVLDLAADA